MARYSVKGKLAIVTGAGSGIGHELALGLARRGARVVATDIVPDRVDRLAREICGEADSFVVDHADREQVRAFHDAVMARHGRVDIVCANAGIGAGAPVQDLTLQDWDWVMGANMYSTIYMVHHFVPHMIRQRSGALLITASGAGMMGIPGLSAYCTSKFALMGLAESLRMELFRHGIRVSVLCPGFVSTDIVRSGRIRFPSRDGEPFQSKVIRFYEKLGVHPSVVARDGIRALERDIGIMPSPLHMWPAYHCRRLFPRAFGAVLRRVWTSGWIV